MKKLFAIMIALFLVNSLPAQTVQPCSSCLTQGITFTNQSQIDYFQLLHPGCTRILGNVTIHEDYNSISNLDGLSVLTFIGGNLEIYGNDILENLTGLNNLDSVVGNLKIYQNPAFLTLDGLNHLTRIGGDMIIWGYGNTGLTSLTGLNDLTSIGGTFELKQVSGLTNLSGLESLDSIGEGITIQSNHFLSDILALNNLNYLGGNISITENYSLHACDAAWLCNYLSNPNGVVHVHGNASGCNSIIELEDACGDSAACLPFGDYTFCSQSDIDSFQSVFPGCTDLQGGVYISGNTITNLSGLELITSIGGNLSISGNNSLDNMSGLDNLVYVGGGLDISENENLTSLVGLDNLTSIPDHLNINSNMALTNLTGLENLTSVAGDLGIQWNYSLTNLAGLDNLTSITGNLTIDGNYALTSLAGLDNLTFIPANLNIGYNALTSLAGLDNLTSIGGSLTISGNFYLTSLTGLDDLNSIGGALSIGYYYGGNPALTSLAALDHLTSIGGSLTISLNDSLANLSGLDNINPGSITDLYINYNPKLSDCKVQSICEYLAAPNGFINIFENAPGCNSEQEADSACVYLSSGDIQQLPSIAISPNPASITVTIETPAGGHLQIITMSGRLLLEEEISEPKTTIDISGLKSGVYFVRVTNDKTTMIGKFIKN